MVQYMTTHQQMMKNKLSSIENKKELDELLEVHETRLHYFQHERLIHLLVTLAVGIVLVMSIFMTLVIPHAIFFLIDILLCMLFVPYIFHYRKLENGVQNLYKLGDEIRKKKENEK